MAASIGQARTPGGKQQSPTGVAGSWGPGGWPAGCSAPRRAGGRRSRGAQGQFPPDPRCVVTPPPLLRVLEPPPSFGFRIPPPPMWELTDDSSRRRQGDKPTAAKYESWRMQCVLSPLIQSLAPHTMRMDVPLQRPPRVWHRASRERVAGWTPWAV